MQQSEQIGDLVSALTKAQAVLSAPEKNREVEVFSKRTNSKYRFRYTTLDAIIEHVRKPLTANGLWFVQSLANNDGRYCLHTKLVHSSGQWIASETPILTETKDPQDFGAAITYMKRYSLAAILGVAADDDTDASPQKTQAAKAEKPAKQTPEQQAAAWVERQKNIIREFPNRVIFADWKAQNKATLEKLHANHPDIASKFSDWLTEWYDSKEAA